MYTVPNLIVEHGNVVVVDTTYTKVKSGIHTTITKLHSMDARDFENASGITNAPSEFERYFIRALLRNNEVASYVGTAMRDYARSLSISSDAYTATDFVNTRSGIPTLLSDLYRVLVHPERVTSTYIDSVSDTTAGKLLNAYLDSDAYQTTKDNTKGNHHNAAIAAIDVLTTLINNVSPKEAQQDKQQQDAAQEKEQQENESTESTETDTEEQQDNSDNDTQQDSSEQDQDDQDSTGDNITGDVEQDEQDEQESTSNSDSSSDSQEDETEDTEDTSGASESDSGDDMDQAEETDSTEDTGDDIEQENDTEDTGDDMDQDSGNAMDSVGKENPFQKAAAQLRPVYNENKTTEAMQEITELANEFSLQNATFNYGIDADSEDISSVETLANNVVALMNNYQSSIKSIDAVMNLLGRTDSLLGEARMKSRHGDGEVVDVMLGADTSRMIASEYVMLATEELEPLYYTRMAEEQLLMTERKGVDDGGNGPLFIMVDISGSAGVKVNMNGTRPTIRDVEFSLALSLARYSNKWNRPIIIMPFNTTCYDNYAFVSGINGISNKTTSKVHATLTKCIGIRTSGGTCFSSALNSALDYIQKLPATFTEHCDILYLTDGEDSYASQQEGLQKQQADKLAEHGIRLFGFIIRDTTHEQTLRGIEKDLSGFFHIVVATAASDMAAGITRLFSAIIASSFYEVGGDKM